MTSDIRWHFVLDEAESIECLDKTVRSTAYTGSLASIQWQADCDLIVRRLCYGCYSGGLSSYVRRGPLL
ncbi:hypothetical protein FAIPA1_30272 [Frankia sp. AiPs1]